MKKLIKLLKKSGVGFISGNYNSNYSLDELVEKMISKRVDVKLSINGSFLGEYPLRVTKIHNGKALCSLLKRNTESAFNVDGNPIIFFLSPFEGTNNDIGIFIARGPLGIP